jgi:uncharacterized membrane protein
MGIIGLIVAVVLIMILVMAMQKGNSYIEDASSVKTPLEIARERYTQGEISAEEFEKIKKNLRLRP